jgi:hypothetical protein
MTCVPIQEPEFPNTYESAAELEGGVGSGVPNEGAGCAVGTGVIRLKQHIATRVRLPVDHGAVAAGTVLTARLTIRDGRTQCGFLAYTADVSNKAATFSIGGIATPGLFEASTTVYSGETAVGSKRYWVEVESTTDARNCNDPLTIAELRLELRDQCAAQNELFERLEFNDEQLVWAIKKSVNEFNAFGQPATAYTVATFPGEWRTYLVSGAAGYALRTATIAGDRDGLKYQAGGVTAMESDVAVVRTLSQELLSIWHDWVRMKKVEINLEGAWGFLGSDYGNGNW